MSYTSIIKRELSIRIHNAIFFLKNYGMVQLIIEIFRKLGFQFFNNSVIFAMLDLNNFHYEEDNEKSHSFHIATIDEVKWIENYQNERYTLKQTIYRINKGHRLFVQKVDNKMVNFVWIAQKTACLDWFRMPLNIPHNMVYEYGGYTVPEYRNKGFATRNKKDIFRYLKKEGVRYVLAVLVSNNLAARKIHKDLGFVEYQTVHYRRYWHIRYYNVTKANSTDRKRYISLFKSPKNLWKTFAF